MFGSLGVAFYGQREIAFVQDDVEKRSKIFFQIFFMKLITMLISIVLYFFIYARNGEYSIYYKILLLEFIANCLDISWFFQGMEEFQKTITRNIIVKILSIASIFIFIKTPDDVWKYVAIYGITTFLGNIVLWFGLFKYVKPVKLKDINVFKHLKPALLMFIPQIAIQIYTVLDKTMIGAITGDMSQVGYYEQAQKIVKMLLTIITSIGTVMMPRLAKNYIEGNFETIKKYMYKTFKFIYLLAVPLIFGLISVSDNFVPLFFGEGYDEVIPLMKIMSLIILIIGFGNIIGSQYLLATKKQNQFTISVVCGAIVNVVFNLILIWKYKAIGASIATVIAEFSVTSVQFWFIRKDFKIGKILTFSAKYIIAGLVMFIISLSINNIIKDKLISICLQVLVGAISYFILLFILREELCKEYAAKFMQKIYGILKRK